MLQAVEQQILKAKSLTNAQISNNVDIQSGKLTSGAEQITGSINNDANLVLDGNLNKNNHRKRYNNSKQNLNSGSRSRY